MGKSLPYFCVRNSLAYCYALKEISSNIRGEDYFCYWFHRVRVSFFVLGQLLSLCSYSEQVDLCTESQKEIIFFFFPRSVRAKWASLILPVLACCLFLWVKRKCFGDKQISSSVYWRYGTWHFVLCNASRSTSS